MLKHPSLQNIFQYFEVKSGRHAMAQFLSRGEIILSVKMSKFNLCFKQRAGKAGGGETIFHTCSKNIHWYFNFKLELWQHRENNIIVLVNTVITVGVWEVLVVGLSLYLPETHTLLPWKYKKSAAKILSCPRKVQCPSGWLVLCARPAWPVAPLVGNGPSISAWTTHQDIPV